MKLAVLSTFVNKSLYYDPSEAAKAGENSDSVLNKAETKQNSMDTVLEERTAESAGTGLKHSFPLTRNYIK